MEHRFTLPQIDNILQELNLKFIGFEFPDGEKTKNAYRAHFPQDPEMTNLGSWNNFETMYPDTFRKMYNFWCQKAQ